MNVSLHYPIFERLHVDIVGRQNRYARSASDPTAAYHERMGALISRNKRGEALSDADKDALREYLAPKPSGAKKFFRSVSHTFGRGPTSGEANEANLLRSHGVDRPVSGYPAAAGDRIENTTAAVPQRVDGRTEYTNYLLSHRQRGGSLTPNEEAVVRSVCAPAPDRKEKAARALSHALSLGPTRRERKESTLLNSYKLKHAQTAPARVEGEPEEGIHAP